MFTFFYLQYIFSLALPFQLTNMFDSSSYLKRMCILLTSKACVSPLYCSSSRTSHRFCFCFHYLFFTPHCMQVYCCSLYSSKTLFILSLWYHLSSFEFSWILGENVVYSLGHTFCCSFLYLCPYCYIAQDSYSFYLLTLPFFLILPFSPETFFSYPCFQLLPICKWPQNSEYADPSEFLIYIFKYPKDILT